MAYSLKRKFFISIVLVFIFSLILLFLNSGKDIPGSFQETRTITLYCDTALRPVMEEIINLFQRRSDIRILPEYAASNTLLDALLEDPEAADLFLAVDVSFLERARDAGRVDTVYLLAQTSPVLMLRSGISHTVQSIDDLVKTDTRIGLPDWMSALGHVTSEILEKHGMTLEDIQHNIVMQDASATELANAIRTDRIDAAIVWAPIARMIDRGEWVSFPDEKNVVAAIGIACSTRPSDVRAAEDFIAFLQMRAAQDDLVKHHYELPVQP